MGWSNVLGRDGDLENAAVLLPDDFGQEEQRTADCGQDNL